MCVYLRTCVHTYQLLAHERSRIVSPAAPVAEEADVLIASDLA